MTKIGTLNESSLHEALKKYFAPDGAKNEVAIGKYICDIVCDDNKVIEIQTANLSNLQKKLSALLETHVVEVVFPIVENNYVRVFAEDNAITQKSFRKSPKHESFFSLFREVTRIYNLLENQNFSLHLAFVDIETVKIDDKKGRSRYGNARITDKKLLKVNSVKIIKNLQELFEPVLERLPKKFSAKDLQKLTDKKNAGFTLWVLKKSGAVVQCEKIGKQSFYSKETRFNSESS